MVGLVRCTFFACGLLIAGVLHAAVTLGGPTIGLWWNPTESGRGYNIDIQGNTMLVTTFIYQTNGDPIWYLSSGTYDENTGLFQSTYDSFSDGQCFGCPHTPPVVHSGAGGPITIAFHSNVTATLYYPGGSTEIVKYLYGFSSPAESLLGEWSYTFLVGGLLGGDWILFTSLSTDSSGNIYATGFDDGGLGYSAVGTYDAGTNAFYIVVTQGPYQHAYKVYLDDHRGNGSAWVIPTGGTISGNGAGAFVARMLFGDQTPIAGSNSAKAARIAFDQAALVDSGGGAVNPIDSEIISRLQSVTSGIVRLSPKH